MNDAAAAELSPERGDFHGRPTRRIANGSIWLDALAEGGPRVVRLGRQGSPVNLLAETPDAGWDTPSGRFELVGGHRLWFAPEDPDRVAVPDGTGLQLIDDGISLRLDGPVEPSGIARSVEISLGPSTGAGLEMRHELHNAGRRPLELAAWAITQLPLGGSVVLPEEPACDKHAVRPNRHLVLWPYTSRDDGRLVATDGRITIDGRAGRNFKVGYLNSVGWVGYVREGTMLVRRFRVDRAAEFPDLGCNVEVFVGDRFVELEVLGPLVVLEPGATVVHLERWELLEVAADADAIGVASVATSGTEDWTRQGRDGLFGRGSSAT